MMTPNQNSQSDFINPIVTFTSIIVFGVVIALFVVNDDSFIGPIIILSFVIGGIVTAFEIRVLIRRRKFEKTEKSDEKRMDKKEKLARFVSDLFEDDIPFDEPEVDKKSEGTISDQE